MWSESASEMRKENGGDDAVMMSDFWVGSIVLVHCVGGRGMRMRVCSRGMRGGMNHCNTEGLVVLCPFALCFLVGRLRVVGTVDIVVACLMREDGSFGLEGSIVAVFYPRPGRRDHHGRCIVVVSCHRDRLFEGVSVLDVHCNCRLNCCRSHDHVLVGRSYRLCRCCLSDGRRLYVCVYAICRILYRSTCRLSCQSLPARVPLIQKESGQ